jgi:hypothetical protein
VARTTLGTRRQDTSRTALFAYVAAQLAGLSTGQINETFRSWGLAITQDSATRAASAARVPSTKQRPGRRPSRVAARKSSNVLRDWLLVDELRLDLEVAFIRWPGNGARQSELIAGLSSTDGVRHIFETSRARDVYAIVVFDGVEQRRALRARLEELADVLEWEDILFETQEPSISLWRMLAQRAAQTENLSSG